jgi:hypothetical protein
MADIVQRIDEILAPFMMGVASGRKGGMTKGSKLPDGLAFGKLDDLFSEVLYHKNKNRKEAIEDVIKKHKLDRKAAKYFRKHMKKTLG